MSDVINTIEPSTLSTAKAALLNSFDQATTQIIHEAPKVLAMIVVVVVGYIVARLAARIFTVLGERLGLQLAAEQSGLAESMRHMGIKRNVPAIVGTIVFWLLMCVFVTAAFNILGLTAALCRHRSIGTLHPELVGGHGHCRGRPAGRQLPARIGGHQRRSAGGVVC